MTLAFRLVVIHLLVYMFDTSGGVQALALVLEEKPVNVPTGVASTYSRPCTRSPLNCALFAPDRMTDYTERKKASR